MSAYATELRLFYAIELRLFYATESRLFYARNAIVLRNRIAIVLRTMCGCLTHDVRMFYARYAIVLRTVCDCLCAEGADAQVPDYCLLMKKMGKSLVVWEIIRIFAA